MKSSALPYWLAFAVLIAAAYGAFKWYQVEQWRSSRGALDATEINLPPLTDFELTERSGKPFRSADMKGKVWVASLFFATCEGSCKRLNDNIKYLTTLDELRDVTWVSITVDPATDTLDKLREYADARSADPNRWLFCRAEDFNYVQRLADDVLRVGGVSYKSHNDYAVIVDKHGKVAGMFTASSNRESLRGVEIIKKCLAEKYSPPKSDVAARPGEESSAQTAPRVRVRVSASADSA